MHATPLGPGPDQAAAGMARRALSVAWTLTKRTVQVAMQYRVTALAAEVGFFALLSLPPLVLALAASAARVGGSLGLASDEDLQEGVRQFLTPFLTEDVVTEVVLPTLSDALNTPRYDIISLGFLIALWSGSRALNVYVDTIAIMYGQAGRRGLVRTRLLSFGLYLLTMVLGSLTLPLVLVGPSLLSDLLPSAVEWVVGLYWPVVGLAGVVLIAWLFHLSTPVRSAWWRDLPGAVLGLVIWVLASAALRGMLTLSLSPSNSATRSLSIYGPLTTPIIIMLWLYLLAVAVLIGAALNAAFDQLWPDEERARARQLGQAQADEAGRGTTLTPVRDTDLEKRQRAVGAAAVLSVARSDRADQVGVVADVAQGGDPPAC